MKSSVATRKTPKAPTTKAPPAADPTAPLRYTRLRDGLILLIAGMLMAAWTWGRWPDVVVDFGRELYVPWQITQGKGLYADLTHLNGPFSVYFNALCFAVGGVSLMTLVVANLLILGVITGLLYLLLEALGGSLAALAGGLFFLIVFAFSQLVLCGNFNFVTPYAHEITHGVLLALAALYALHRWRVGGRNVWLAAGGLGVGLLALTKVEVFLAGAAATAAALVLTLAEQRPARRRLGAVLGIFLGSAVLPLMLALGLLGLAMPVRVAWQGMTGAYIGLFRSDISQLHFYQHVMGMDAPGTQLLLLLRWSVYYLGCMGLAAGLSFCFRKPKIPAWATGGLAFACVLCVGILFLYRIPWSHIASPLPLMIMIALGGWCGVYWMQRRGRIGGRLPVLPISFSLFALLLLAKIILNVRLYHYGFALAMPAAMAAIAGLTQWLPRLIERRGGSGALFCGAMLAVLMTVGAAHVMMTHRYVAQKKIQVGKGADRFWADERGGMVNQALQQIGQHIAPNQTLLVLPEGIMLNYLSRRVNPTRYDNLMPLEVKFYGEDAIVADFKKAAPDFIALVHKDTTEYGFPFFGKDYGRRIQAWIAGNYHAVSQIGARPFQGPYFGILILQRN